ncbi:hypothetical protein [Christiangramia sp. SM2212]|uniref:Serine acetyltransferase n=1 Tax=Christiangramia sediminicola TaxID=3073267 RepID=A0ABU1ELS6_9FLAO|nr:hypothetical protein [Christiangramia sp. SM2212]MDR5589339.1 hypothetical protein [Christiangramia sp. SM2212]
MLIHFYRIGNFLYRCNVPVLPKLIYYIQYLLFNCAVPSETKIGKKSTFGYGGIGVVLHKRVVIGDNCKIGTNVTIGGTSKKYEVPIIGNRVQISTGAKILGPVTIGNDVIIGANSVVVKDVPSNCVVAGIPAKVIKENIQLSDYRNDIKS